MAIRIFDVDPDSAPKENSSSDLVGRFRSGYVANGRPASLSEWRVTSDDPDVTDAIAALYGGSPAEWDNEKEPYEVYTDASSVDVLLDGPGAIRTGMVLWGRNGKIRGCDGITQDDDAKSPCVCPSTVRERKDAAKAGHGCEPSIGIYFRLADSPDLGKFRFQTGSWSMVTDLVRDKTEEKLAEVKGLAIATLALEEVSFEAKNGPRKGQTVSYMKPVIKVRGAAPKTVAASFDVQPDEEPF